MLAVSIDSNFPLMNNNYSLIIIDNQIHWIIIIARNKLMGGFYKCIV